jgi:folate-binding protein YgfZ
VHPHTLTAAAEAHASMPDYLPAFCTDTRRVVLHVRGDDAIEFLHGQLSSDVRALAPGEGQAWTYNSPKGRVLANGVLWRAPPGHPPGVTLVLAADLADAIRRRLAMFVLRAKVTIEDAGASSALIGLAGEDAVDAARAAFGVTVQPWRAVPSRAAAVAFLLPDGRALIVAPDAEGPVLQAALARHASHASDDEWRWYGIVAGVPLIRAATTDLFVAQTLNLDLLGAINFRKGCYPGQEIIARMQYLGRLKERLFAFHVDALDVAPGARLYSPGGASEAPCGTVVDAAPDRARGSVLLAVAQLAAVEANEVALGAPDGPRLVRRPLPYDVPGAPTTTAPAAPG